jgi:hypothetical protein
LTHLDSEHNDEHWKTYKKVEANLTKIHDDPSHAIRLGPPAVTTLEPTSGPEDEDEMTFTGTWFTPALPIDPPNIEDYFSPAVYCCPTTESEPPALIPRHEIYDSDDDDSDDDDIASDDRITEPEVKFTKRVHKKKNSRVNVQEVLSEAEGEGTEWIECDNLCDLTSSIDSTYFDKLTVLAFAWSICMGFIQSLLEFGWTTCVRPPWDMIAIPLFWQSTIFWDTVAYFVGTPCPPNTPSRRVKRSVARYKRIKNCNMPSLFFGSMVWMVLGGSILIPTVTFQGPAHPFSTMTRQLKVAYTRVQGLDEAVDFSPSTFIQYQSLEANKLWKEIKTEEKKNEVNGHGCSFEFDESEFFDAYENLPIYREEFFDCLEKFESENYDTWTRRDILDLDGTYRDLVVVD